MILAAKPLPPFLPQSHHEVLQNTFLDTAPTNFALNHAKWYTVLYVYTVQDSAIIRAIFSNTFLDSAFTDFAVKSCKAPGVLGGCSLAGKEILAWMGATVVEI